MALDFETADVAPSSACALGLGAVRHGRLVRVCGWRIRPAPGTHFRFTPLHGIGAIDVENAPDVDRTLRRVAAELQGATFVAAHHAPFDARVLAALVERCGIEIPHRRFVCTARLSRLAFAGCAARLPTCARALGIPIRHHDARADAVASARIVLAAAARVRGRRAIAGLVETARLWS